MLAVEECVGKKVRIEIDQYPSPLEGEVFTVYNGAVILVLPSKEKRSFSFINAKNIKKIDILGDAVTDIAIGTINTEKIMKRDAIQTNKAKKQQLKIGVGVTEEAQALYSFLDKTFPCEWRGENIVIFEEVLLAPPYTIDSIKLLEESGAKNVGNEIRSRDLVEKAVNKWNSQKQ